MKTAFLFLLLLPVFLQAQKPKNREKKEVLSFEEQWAKDSIELEKKYQNQWVKDSLKFENEQRVRSQKWEKIYSERYNPKDSLYHIDQKTKTLFQSKDFEDADNVVAIINLNFKTSLHKARAIYYWICTNIKYDSVSYLSGNITFYNDIAKDAKHTFRRKVGVCAHYTSLFQYMAEGCGLESSVVNGYAKLFPFKYVSEKTNHAWNVIRINEKRILIDPTWGVAPNNQVESFWFNTAPDIFIYSHFPSDSGFQLIKKEKSFIEFQLLPIVDDNFFLSKIPFIIPTLGYFSNSTGVLQIEAADTKKTYSLKFTAYPVSAVTGSTFTSYTYWQEIPYVVKPSNRKGYSIIEAQVPGKGAWWVKIDITENITIGKEKHRINFPNSLMFQVTRL
jgi:transglutaminase/protease-like cytokinesis protein 3